MRVAIYVRVSTQDQSTTMQETELLAYAASRGWQVTRVYSDSATGTTTTRKALQELIRASNERLHDVVLVWKLDRIFRSLKDCITQLSQFDEVGIQFVSLKDPGMDMTTASGRLLMHMIGAFAEFEASMIKMRVVAGLDQAKRRGTRLGRPITIDHAYVEQLRASGASYSKIAKQMGISKSAVAKILT